MIRIFITCFIALSLGVNAYADVKSSVLEKASSKVSSTVSNLIPGEGLTEVDISYRENLDNNIEINVALASSSPIGVDTKEDYLALKKIMEYKV